MRLGGFAAVLALALATPTAAQDPLPNTIASSGLTRAQEQELNNRLTRLQGRFNALASQTQLQQVAVRNIAVELFGAQPDLDFETYAGLIENGARELQTYLASARARTETDPALAALRNQAIAAAEAGRLTEARTLYDQLISQTTAALEARWAEQDAAREAERNVHRLANAADMAEAARLAFIAADFADAARRYGEAAARAPEGTRERWLYTVRRAEALRERGVRFGADDLRQATDLLEHTALTIAPGETERLETLTAYGGVMLLRAERGDTEAAAGAFSVILASTLDGDGPEHAAAQNRLGTLQRIIAERGMTDGSIYYLSHAMEHYQRALRIRSRRTMPAEWAESQHNLAVAMTLYFERDPRIRDASGPVRMLRDVLQVRTRAADPFAWAESQDALGNALRVAASGDSAMLREALAAFDAALEVRTRDAAPVAWAQTQHNRAIALLATDDPANFNAALDALRAAQEFRTRSGAPGDWAMTELVIGLAHLRLSAQGDASHRARARAAFTESRAVFQQLRHFYWVDQSDAMLALVP